MNYTIRTLANSDIPLLNDFLYEAIFIPEGEKKPPRSIIELPELQVYIKNFGETPDDCGFVAEVDGEVVGMVWVRIMNDYGHVADDIPSLVISLLEGFRGAGIGTALLQTMLFHLKDNAYERVSLSVDKKNYAVKLYQKLGFTKYCENDVDYIMIADLQTI